MYNDRHREARRGASSKLRDPRSATPCAPSRKARPPAPLPQSSRRCRCRGRAAVVDRLLGRHEIAPHVRAPLVQVHSFDSSVSCLPQYCNDDSEMWHVSGSCLCLCLCLVPACGRVGSIGADGEAAARVRPGPLRRWRWRRQRSLWTRA